MFLHGLSSASPGCKPLSGGCYDQNIPHRPAYPASSAGYITLVVMIDTVLKYLSVITVSGAAISFVIGLIKYLDQRSREEKTKRFELYHDLMCRVSAQGVNAGDGLPLTQQLAAIYELQHFEEYAYASIPILEHIRIQFSQTPAASPLVAAINATLAKLKA